MLLYSFKTNVRYFEREGERESAREERICVLKKARVIEREKEREGGGGLRINEKGPFLMTREC